ncbi:cyclic nucleotide-binding domain-containing protein [Sinimarinibacterium sp. CAU 1509]|uniref:cyclic nucleotide-binding domain-containing protein n=1 Tax=Sinimarinibacterium sp. CAU 1509 TaxID=2562283 RepID=UPI0010AD7CDD|nr:cyclic nucleotide-binding domain-containing protein [Sinimarinibacterium sp. CAU 1509]TJY59291.1 cyclic nucleotide-binding domain-containing protein [Sinimarinibacterium sp. CAU 1509]
MKDLEQILQSHAFLGGCEPEYVQLLVGCARNLRFDAGEYLLREGAAADEFYLIRHGKVALEINVPGKAPIVFSTLGEGEIVGASWLVPPYRWTFDARAVELTRAIGIDAACLRRKCDADSGFGYAMMKRFVPILSQRLHATRLQLLDVYGKP